MSGMAEKLQSAGVDTIGARLTTACTEAIRLHQNSVADAWRCVGEAFGYELLRGLMADMQPNVPAPETKFSRSLYPSVSRPTGEVESYKPRIIPPERLERRSELQKIVRSKYKNSSGVAWSDVGWHELTPLARDGKEAAALLQAGPASVPNDGRTVGDVLGVAKIDQVIEGVRL